MSRLKLKAQKLKVKPSDIPNLTDAIFFYGNPARPGWVEMYANEKGRNCVNGLFPNATISWTYEDRFATGWFGFEINLPNTVVACEETNRETKLPFDVMKSAGVATINDCSQKQLAVLLAFGVNRDGGRSAISDGKRYEMFVRKDN